jgi:NhaP-type Na+/H+ or K+/H+ antiporter
VFRIKGSLFPCGSAQLDAATKSWNGEMQSERLLQPGRKSSVLTLSWGGLRGGLSISLGLSIPETTQGRAWILATTYLVVAFSVVVQRGTLDLFLKRVCRFD